MIGVTALDKLYPAPKDGKPGNDAVVYSIVCSNSNPNVTDSDVSVTLTAYMTVGSEREMCTFDGHLCFGNATEGQYINDNPATIVMPKGSTKAVIIELIDEDVLAVCTISPVVNGVNGTSVLAQYCPSRDIISIGGTSKKPDESNIHDSYKDGDEWMRTKSSTDAAYGSWFRIVGENGADGEYTDYTFNLSKDKTTKDAYTVPGNLKSTTWTDGPQVPNTDYPYLWMRMERKNLPAFTAILVDQKYTYVRLTGEDGKTVTAQYSVDGNTNWHSPFATGDIWMRTSEDGGKTWGTAVRIVGEKGDGGAWTDYRFNISSALTTSSPLTAPTPLGRSSWADAPMATTDVYPYLWMMVQKYSDTTTKDGQPTYMRLTGEQGKPGQTGGVGPMMYYAGEWQSGVSYVRTAQVVPLVSHGSDQFYYYPAKEGTLLNNEPSSSNTAWKQQQKVPLLLAELLMVKFGKIGDAVFADHLMMSQQGVDSVGKTASYEAYDGNPDGDGDFNPNLYLNFLTGKMRAVGMEAIGGKFHDVDVSGTVSANLLYGRTKTVVFTSTMTTYVIDPKKEPATTFFVDEPGSIHGNFFKLPKASDYDGLEITIFCKHMIADTRMSVDAHNVYVLCAEATDHFYVKQNVRNALLCGASSLNDTKMVTTVEEKWINFTDFIGTSVKIQMNDLVKFKSIGGSWYAIEGLFTGE